MQSWSLVAFLAGIGLAGQMMGQSERVVSLAEEPKATTLDSQRQSFASFRTEYRFVLMTDGKEHPASQEFKNEEASPPFPPAASKIEDEARPALQVSAEDNVYGRDSPRTQYEASSYVPLDSWIYPAFDRLAAMGFVETGTVSIRPQSRLELARLLAEAHENRNQGDWALDDLFVALDREFTHETGVIDGTANRAGTLDSLYSRLSGIAGVPLRDGFHFGQTIGDDFGRPYGQGVNAINGISGHAEAGPFALYLRGEYQYAAAITPYSAEVDETIASSDQASEAFQPAGGVQLPANWNMRAGTTNRLRPVEAYGTMNVANWQISFGQQSLWWGPNRTTSLMLSNNAEAMPMLRFARVMPAKLPLLGWLGPVHFDSFFARQGGIYYVALGSTFQLYGQPNQALTPPPYLWGATVSFEPTKNLELGFGHTTIFAGYGRPLTLKTFLHTFSMYGNAQATDPGKRVTEFNLYYHVPWLRKSLVVYTEGMAWDDPIQGSFFSRFAMDPGIYLPHIPRFKNLDLRVEGVYTDLPGLKYLGYFYGNAHYPQGYTNYGQILGSWVGRQGSGVTATSTYWFSARTKAVVTYRKMIQDKALLQGGNLNDISGSWTWMVRPGIEITAAEQYERWRFPLLANGPRSNGATSFEIRFSPKKHR